MEIFDRKTVLEILEAEPDAEITDAKLFHLACEYASRKFGDADSIKHPIFASVIATLTCGDASDLTFGFDLHPLFTQALWACYIIFGVKMPFHPGEETVPIPGSILSSTEDLTRACIHTVENIIFRCGKYWTIHWNAQAEEDTCAEDNIFEEVFLKDFGPYLPDSQDE